MKIAIIGASGRIGSTLAEFLKDRYSLRLADLDLSKLEPYQASKHEIQELNVADLDACQIVCKGIDVVIHLAGDPSPDAGFYESLLENNIKGTFNMFRAAKDQGVQRIIFASSAQTIEGYPLDAQIYSDMPTRPRNLYGVSKCFGESLASYFAYSEGLQSIVVRIGSYDSFQPDAKQLTARDMSAYISPQDLCDLLLKAIQAEELPPFTILHGISDNRFKRLNLDESKKRVGYAPKSDAFQLSQIPLHDERR
ncbi:NAD(P)-dependent oxidoreductase [Brevibacillus choshinensis]|uniref:NAD-dependent epimerase/dehydratase family protein n=1 Tax=Brevibacillus choshinensis TaxID=54911 RepID=UPI002E1F0FC4|nr:NAD(P)-dependent oxidoreductase [Brevibacillus choshinensis]MED4752958.1 NAD(P)-dependent oxidoreductase [Brevibacillus choshinensis]MED4781466.1 NAD(P)-dependent oxidoreductase [Brevibacillus choshinensis]